MKENCINEEDVRITTSVFEELKRLHPEWMSSTQGASAGARTNVVQVGLAYNGRATLFTTAVLPFADTRDRYK